MTTLKVAAYTQGKDNPSARFRVRQLIPTLAGQGIQLREFAAPVSSYPPRRRLWRPLWLGGALITRLPQVIAGYAHEVTLLQREFVSTLSTLEALTRRPRILDVDDAICLHRRGDFAARLARNVDLVVCGNRYLAGRFSQWNANVAVVPTAVDCTRLKPRANVMRPATVIGWIGTSSNSRYLEWIEPALAQVLRNHPAVRLRIVSDEKPNLRRLPSEQVQFVPWTETLEADAIRQFDVGLMPLTDGDWERGKCSYKMLQYMASGIPVVVSPVGMNAEVLALGNVGLGARALADWSECMEALLISPGDCANMGNAGRAIALRHFSIPAIAPLLAAAIRSVV